MDSSLYKYFIEELQNAPDNNFSNLPIFFVKSVPYTSKEAFDSCKSFLIDMVSKIPENPDILPQLFLKKDNFFSSLFIHCHKAFIDILSGESAQTHEFRHDGTQLLKFLVYCGYKGIPESFFVHDASECAMICFIIEALLHCGWCPDSFDGVAKRAAHEYFVCLKKEMHHVDIENTATVLGYLWCAWVFSQKTEGIRDNGEKTLTETALFEWGLGSDRRQYIVRKSSKAPLFYIIPKCSNVLPHPFHFLAHDRLLGLTFSIHGETLLLKELTEYSDILRPKISGHKFVYACRIRTSMEIAWTMVFLHFESTVYRIDLLKFSKNIDRISLHAEMRIENENALEKIEDGHFLGKNKENFIIRFIENPLKLEFSKQLGPEISVFSSKEMQVSPNDSIKITTAWAQGKGIKDINRTHLLGIYD
jgi:hypothetical protein